METARQLWKEAGKPLVVEVIHGMECWEAGTPHS